MYERRAGWPPTLKGRERHGVTPKKGQQMGDLKQGEEFGSKGNKDEKGDNLCILGKNIRSKGEKLVNKLLSPKKNKGGIKAELLKNSKSSDHPGRGRKAAKWQIKGKSLRDPYNKGSQAV